MVLKRSTLVGGSSGAASNDFTLNLGTSGYTKSVLSTNFPAGSYVVTSTNLDSTLDVYLLDSEGTLAGVANAGATSFTISPTKEFNTVIVYGGTSNEALSFVFKYVFNTSTNSTADFTAVGPRIISITPSSLPNQNDTISITGQNFAEDVEVTFTGTDLVAISAKSIVRGSSTSLTVTRPDSMPVAYNPYTITTSNPGLTSPTSSNAHKSINSVSAGSSPVWVTTSTINYDFSVSWNGGSLSATDSDGGSSVTYSVVSGSLPSGVTLSSNGTFSGTPTTSQVSATIRATDSGGNFIDRTFLFNRKPVWVTTSLAQATQGSSYSQTLSATDDTSISSYTLVSGTLPTGLSLNTSTGAITGTPSAGNNNTLTFRATDSNGGTQDKNLSIGTLVVASFTSSGSWVAPAGVSSVNALVVAGGGGGGNGSYGGHGGGGAGGVRYVTSQAVTPGTTYTVTIGAGSGAGSSGSPTSFGSLISCTGGGRGGGNSTTNNNDGGQTAQNGGSGGGGAGDSGFGSASNGAWRNPGAGISGEGNSGANSTGGGFGGGGGGGKGSSGSGISGGSGASYTLAGIAYAVGGGGASSSNGSGGSGGSGGGGSTYNNSQAYSGGGHNGTVNTGGGGAGMSSSNFSSSAGSGGSGVVRLEYIA